MNKIVVLSALTLLSMSIIGSGHSKKNLTPRGQELQTIAKKTAKSSNKKNKPGHTFLGKTSEDNGLSKMGVGSPGSDHSPVAESGFREDSKESMDGTKKLSVALLGSWSEHVFGKEGVDNLHVGLNLATSSPKNEVDSVGKDTTRVAQDGNPSFCQKTDSDFFNFTLDEDSRSLLKNSQYTKSFPIFLIFI